MSWWAKGIEAITLFVEDLEAAKRFYTDVFELPVMFEDDSSAVFNFGNTVINLLAITSAPELIGPATVATREAGSRLQLTLEVDDVDARCALLSARGVELVNGPMNRPWGIGPRASPTPAGTCGRSRRAFPSLGMPHEPHGLP